MNDLVTKKSIFINNMNTHEDADHVSKVLHDIWGIRQVEVQLDKKSAIITYDEKAATIQDFHQGIVENGFFVMNEEDGSIEQKNK